jgi:polar amino acid transport system substrate-binding protein
MFRNSRNKLILTLGALMLVVFALSACTNAPEPADQPTEAPTEAAGGETNGGEEPGDDLLAAIEERGTLIISTDPGYPPQSELKADAVRAEDTKCEADQHTASEFEGFDIAVAVAIAEKLGVEPCFVTPEWDVITAGGWADRWDISVGSMTILPSRMESLYFTQPYYATPAAFFVHADNATFSSPASLSGKKVGLCGGCTYEYYMDHTLDIPGLTIDFIVDDAVVTVYDTDSTALEDLVIGDGTRLDAVLTAQPTGQGYVDEGKPIKQLGDPVFNEYLAAAIDKAGSLDSRSFVERVNEIIQGLHDDGTLLELSTQYFGEDLTSGAGEFDFDAAAQFD